MSIPEVEVDEAVRMVEAGAHLLDVREASEWEAGHSPLAAWIPLGELGARLDEVPTDRTVAVVCRSGGRSAAATDALRSTGVDAVNVAGGMKAWANEGFEVVAAQDGGKQLLRYFRRPQVHAHLYKIGGAGQRAEEAFGLQTPEQG